MLVAALSGLVLAFHRFFAVSVGIAVGPSIGALARVFRVLIYPTPYLSKETKSGAAGVLTGVVPW
jgi:hypothetical protein